MAYLAYQLGKYNTAKTYCQKFYETRFSGTPIGKLEINDYLLRIGDYRTILLHNEQYFQRIKEDSLNLLFMRTLYQSAQAYNGLNEHKNAYALMQRLHALQSNLHVSDERNQLFNLADLTQAMKQKHELIRATDKIIIRNHTIAALIIISILLIALLGGFYWSWKDTRRRNKKMTQMILELNEKQQLGSFSKSSVSVVNTPSSADEVQTESSRTGAETDPEKPDDYEVFVAFNNRVKEEKLYLYYQLTRDDYAKFMGVDRNRFAALLKNIRGRTSTHTSITCVWTIRFTYSAHIPTGLSTKSPYKALCPVCLLSTAFSKNGMVSARKSLKSNSENKTRREPASGVAAVSLPER